MAIKVAMVINERENEVELTLNKDGTSQTLGFVTRSVVKVGSVEVDSDINPEAFDWQTDPSRLVLYFGFLDLPRGEYIAYLDLYSVDKPRGVRWGEDGFHMTVKAP